MRFARAAGLADVNVTLQVWPHMIHAWPMWNAKLADGRRALEQVGEFVRRWVRRSPPQRRHNVGTRDLYLCVLELSAPGAASGTGPCALT